MDISSSDGMGILNCKRNCLEVGVLWEGASLAEVEQVGRLGNRKKGYEKERWNDDITFHQFCCGLQSGYQPSYESLEIISWLQVKCLIPSPFPIFNVCSLTSMICTSILSRVDPPGASTENIILHLASPLSRNHRDLQFCYQEPIPRVLLGLPRERSLP